MKGATFINIGKETRKITKLFKDTQIKLASERQTQYNTIYSERTSRIRQMP
jgi:hypothetical protein